MEQNSLTVLNGLHFTARYSRSSVHCLPMMSVHQELWMYSTRPLPLHLAEFGVPSALNKEHPTSSTAALGALLSRQVSVIMATQLSILPPNFWLYEIQLWGCLKLARPFFVCLLSNWPRRWRKLTSKDSYNRGHTGAVAWCRWGQTKPSKNMFITQTVAGRCRVFVTQNNVKGHVTVISQLRTQKANIKSVLNNVLLLFLPARTLKALWSMAANCQSESSESFEMLRHET